MVINSFAIFARIFNKEPNRLQYLAMAPIYLPGYGFFLCRKEGIPALKKSKDSLGYIQVQIFLLLLDR